MRRFGHLFTDIIVISFVALLVVVFMKYQKKDVQHNKEFNSRIDSMFTILSHQDSLYHSLSIKTDTITILRERIITVAETKKIAELKKEIEYLRKQSSGIQVQQPIDRNDPLELYLYFNMMINPPPKN